MLYLLDTNVASTVADPNGNSPALRAKIGEESKIAVSVITVGEMEFGSSRIREKARRDLISERESNLLVAVDVMLNVTLEIAHQYAKLKLHLERAGTQIPENDLWIASTALVHECSLVSGDRYFDRVPNLTRIEL